MVNEGIPASSKYWDDKQISLTENTKNNIIKKAFRFDLENMLSKYGIRGEEALDFAKQNGIDTEYFLSDQNSYTFLALQAITELEENVSKETRVRAIDMLTALGFTNIYEANSKNFILPATQTPKDEEEEKPAPPIRYHRQNIQYAAQQEIPVKKELPPFEPPAEEAPVIVQRPSLQTTRGLRSAQHVQALSITPKKGYAQSRVPLNIGKIERLRPGTPTPKFSFKIKRFVR